MNVVTYHPSNPWENAENAIFTYIDPIQINQM